MITKSPWSVLQAVKAQLRNTESNQTNIITCLCGGDDMNLVGFPIVGASGQYYNFVHTAGTTHYEVDVSTYNEATDTWQTRKHIEADNLDELLDYNDSDISMSAVVSDVQQGISSNQLIADICNSFQSSQNLSLADVQSLINNSDLDISEKRRIGSYVQSAVSKGTISSYGWMGVMQKVFKEGYDAANSGTTIMDKSKPFVLQSIASTIVQTVSNLLSAVALGLKTAFGALLMLVAQLVNTAFNYITKIVNNAVSVDLNSSTWYVKGPSKYAENFGSAEMGHLTNGICRQIFGPYEFYSWMHNPDATDIIGERVDLNGFINVGFDVVKAINKLKNEGWYSIRRTNPPYSTLAIQWNPDGTHYRWGSLIKDALYHDPNLYLSQTDAAAIVGDESKCTKYLHLLLYFDSMLNFRTSDVTGTGVGSEVTYYFADDADIIDAGRSVPLENNDDHKGDMVRAWCGLLGRMLITGQDMDLDSWMSHSVSTQFLQDWYNQFGTNQAPVAPDYNTHTYGYVSYTMREHRLASQWTDTSYIAVLDTCYGFSINAIANDFTDFVDSIPVDRAITIPDMTWDKLALAMSILAVAVATAFIAKKLVTKIMNKRFTAKRLADVRKLNTAREYYQNHPDDQQAYDSFYKEVRRYNLKARLMGWNTYDPINNWFNETSNGTGFAGSIADSQPSIFDRAESATTSLGNIMNNQLPNMQNGDENSISQLVHLIRG